jgi:molybdopterin-guanine dinucleotide biosynthesis protein A
LSARRLRALVLAGERGDGSDPVAKSAGVVLKALAPVGGVPMLERVLHTLAACPEIEAVTVCADPVRLRAAAVGRLAARLAEGKLAVLPQAAGPSASVAAALAATPPDVDLLVTTADHALLTSAMVQTFLAGVPTDADVAAGAVSEEVLRAAFPASRRTYYRFKDGAYSGANLFLLRGPRATQAVRFWQSVERERKRPWRIAAALGPLLLLRFALRRLAMAEGLAILSERVGARLALVPLPMAEAAVDVDRPADLALAETILAGRRA